MQSYQSDDNSSSTLFQVELRVFSGEAKFDSPINSNGKKSICPKDGWVPLQIIHCLPDDSDDAESEDNMSQRAIKVATLAYNDHRINTMRRLEQSGVDAELRLQSYVRGEILLRTSDSYGIKLFDKD